jgi:hypothetical protein
MVFTLKKLQLIGLTVGGFFTLIPGAIIRLLLGKLISFEFIVLIFLLGILLTLFLLTRFFGDCMTVKE